MEGSRDIEDASPRMLVEQFSWELKAQQHTEADSEAFDQLRQDLIAERERHARPRQHEIRRLEAHFKETRGDDAIIFEKAKSQLLVSMKRFQDLVPGAPRNNELPTSWDEVRSATLEAQAGWETKLKESRASKAREWIRKMCNGLNNHATALKMLPTETEYVSVIAGAVTMVIKAAANHVNISEAFAKGVVEINDAVQLEHMSHTYDSPVLQQLTMRLYTEIFSYLIKFMTWFTSNSRTRFLKSFNETNLNLFKEDLAQVKQISTLLSRQVQLHMSDDVRISRLLMENLSDDMQYLLKFSDVGERHSRVRDATNAQLLQKTFQSQLEKTKEEILSCVMGVMGDYNELVRSNASGIGMTNLLKMQASPVPRSRSPHSPMAARALEPQGLNNTTQIQPSRSQSRSVSSSDDDEALASDLRYASRKLEDYFSWDHVHPPSEIVQPLFSEANFVARLNTFTTTMESQILYAHGTRSGTGQSSLTRSAASYTRLALNAGLPVISYFCELSHEEPPPNRTRESVELSALLCSLIRQVVNLLPSGADCPEVAAIDRNRFTALDGTLRTWNEGISLFADLVQCVRLPLLLFVIDDLNVLEDESERSTEEHIERLVDTLTALMRPPSFEEDRIVKMLLTTSGGSEVLFRKVHDDDIVVCDDAPPGRSGRSRRGHQIVMF